MEMTLFNTVILNEVKNPENFFNHYSLDSSLRSEWPKKGEDVIGNEVRHLKVSSIKKLWDSSLRFLMNNFGFFNT